MISIDEYKRNPCRVSPIPYWKMRTFKTPNNITVIHDEEYTDIQNNKSKDTLYFRLKHNLKNIELVNLDKRFKYRYVDFNNYNDLQEVVYIINESYTDIKVNIKQVEQWTRSQVFDPSLWVFIIDINNEKAVALGIAEVDKEVPEGALEWIQVLPEYRNCKLGEAIVKRLLVNLLDKVEFCTVSGEVNNRTDPEKLYRRCGFQGNDIWHILAN